jgi:phosphoglycolate phosphatase
MEKIKAAIYDLDGVLIDSRRANEAFYNQVLRRFGRPDITPEQLAQAQFLTSPEAVTLLFAGTPWLDAALAYHKTVDNEPFLPLITLEAGVKETLARLRSSHLLAIATNRGRSLPLVLERLGLAEFFQMVVSSLDVTHPKPHPESLQMILGRFGLECEQALYVGDTEVDRRLAAHAGVPFAAYKNPGLAAAWHLPDHWSIMEILDPRTRS